MIPFKSLGPNAVYPGATAVTWMAGFEWTAPGDIVEIRWGVAGTHHNKGRVSIGTVSSVTVNEYRDPNSGPVKRADLCFWSNWYEQTMETVIHDGCLMLVPDVREMPFGQTFTLRTNDIEDEAWQLVIRGHDCEGHNFGNGIEVCTSQWLQRVKKYLAEDPEFSIVTKE